MIIGHTYQLTENIRDFLKEEIPKTVAKVAEERADRIDLLPEIRDYKIGYIDVFKQDFYPSILIGNGKLTPSALYSDIYEIEVVFTHKNGNKEALIKEGYLYSDILYYLFRKHYRLKGNSLDVVVVEREHFEGDEIFISALTIRVEVEKGDYRDG